MNYSLKEEFKKEIHSRLEELAKRALEVSRDVAYKLCVAEEAARRLDVVVNQATFDIVRGIELYDRRGQGEGV